MGLSEPADGLKRAAPAAGPDASLHYAAIVQSSDDAIISKDLGGIITSWNKSAERLFGWKDSEIIGQSVLLLIPKERHDEEPGIISRIQRGERIEHYETVRQRKDGTLIDISLTVSPIRDQSGRIIGASKIARDISGRKRAEEKLRQQARHLAVLNHVSEVISRDLDLDRIVQSVTDLGVELSGAKFGVCFYNAVNEAGELRRLHALSGAPRSAFEALVADRNMALFEPTLRGARVIRVGDVAKDPRYGERASHGGGPVGTLPVTSYLAVPVKSASGEPIGGLFFGHDKPFMFGEESEALLTAVAAQAGVAMDNARLHRAAQAEIEQRKKAEEAKEFLLHEIKHRVKNTLGTVQAIATQTFREAPKTERTAFVARLHALADAHDLLTQQSWTTVGVKETIERATRPFQQRDRPRITLTGEDFQINPSNALLLSMIVHELGTNTVKYGAFSSDRGTVDLEWCRAGERLKLKWTERGGPPVVPPTRRGFGTQMIERTLHGEQGSAKLDYAPTGLVCTLEMRL
jgi:PAS domain S-box-containing protein